MSKYNIFYILKYINVYMIYIQIITKEDKY